MSLNGIDISNWQRGLNLSVVPCDFAIMKATEGYSIVHETCDPWVQECKRLGKKWGFYHFLAGLDPVREADFFVDSCLNYFGEGIPVLDYEMYGRAVGTAGAKRFLDRVYERTKVRCVVYTSRSVLTEEDWSAIAPNHALWVAQYANSKPTGYQSDPWFPAGSIGAFQAVTMHQYTSTGRLSGYSGNLDLDIAYLTREAWDRIAKGDREGAAPQPEPQPQPEKKPLPDALKQYVDVDSEAWYVGPLEKAVRAGYLHGYDETHLGPSDVTSRGQAVCMIANATDAEFEHPFDDVVASPFYYDAVEWAKRNEVINGNMDEFRPDDQCTRAEFMTMLCNWMGSTDQPDATKFPDWGQVPDWAKSAVAWAVAKGVVSGSGGMLRPNDPCSRAEAAAMLVNLLS